MSVSGGKWKPNRIVLVSVCRFDGVLFDVTHDSDDDETRREPASEQVFGEG